MLPKSLARDTHIRSWLLTSSVDRNLIVRSRSFSSRVQQNARIAACLCCGEGGFR